MKGLKKVPRVFAFVDWPVFKRERPTLKDVTINDGLHVHAVVLVPWRSRLQTGLKNHVEERQALYLGHHGRLRRVHVARIEAGTEAQVVDYTMKTWRGRRMGMDDVLVLPRAASEL